LNISITELTDKDSLFLLCHPVNDIFIAFHPENLTSISRFSLSPFQTIFIMNSSQNLIQQNYFTKAVSSISPNASALS
jgi:hypothetical protein